MLSLDDPLSAVRGSGRFVKKMEGLDIHTVRDLLWHFPARYDDFSTIVHIADLEEGAHATVRGVIVALTVRKTWGRGMLVVEATLRDSTGLVKATWFNQRFLLARLKKGMPLSIAGKVARASGGGLTFSHPVYEFVKAGDMDNSAFTHTGRLAPIYPETKGLTSKAIRFLLKSVFDNLMPLQDYLPHPLLAAREYPALRDALRMVHFPDTRDEATQGRARFVFENLFFLQLHTMRQRLLLSRQRAYACPVEISQVKACIAQLPFSLTHAQKKALWDILQDCAQARPMNRLLQGDVGSGKTIVAALAAVLFASYRIQTVFMAPTEVLARQHYKTLCAFFPSFEQGIGLVTASGARVWYGAGLESELSKHELFHAVSRDRIAILLGTHSLLHNPILFSRLGFIVIDEQHRFGVSQRAHLIRRDADKGHRANTPLILPHFLSMSATPIPRTLSLALFGDLDLSLIDELPRDRKAITTRVVDSAHRDRAYEFIRKEIKQGRQAFVVCPRIEENSESGMKKYELGIEVKNVKEEYEKLSKKIFPDLRVGMLHGKMKAKEKEDVMWRFKEGALDILVSTSVIEVGVDVPNASIMVIEGAELFGLAQLYQFRGRVGRGAHQSYCLLFPTSRSAATRARLRSLITARNGFELAEKDLALRGPGEFLGDAQTGIPDFAMQAMQDPHLLRDSREAARDVLRDDPDLVHNPLLLEKLGAFGKEVHYE